MKIFFCSALLALALTALGVICLDALGSSRMRERHDSAHQLLEARVARVERALEEALSRLRSADPPAGRGGIQGISDADPSAGHAAVEIETLRKDVEQLREEYFTDARLSFAHREHEDGNYSAAATAYLEILDANPERDDFCQILARARNSLLNARAPEVIRVQERLLDQCAEFFASANEGLVLAQCYALFGDRGKAALAAKAASEKAVELKERVNALKMWAEYAYEGPDGEEAKAEFQKLLEQEASPASLPQAGPGY